MVDGVVACRSGAVDLTVGRYVVGDCRPRADDSVVTDTNTGEDDTARADGRVVVNERRFGGVTGVSCDGVAVVGKGCTRSDENGRTDS